MDLISFLLARIDEDEARARAAAAVPNGDTLLAALPTPLFDGLRIAFPVRVLAECAAKRAIIEKCAEAWDASDCTECNEAGYMGDGLLRVLAAPYSDHPDFDPAWGVL